MKKFELDIGSNFDTESQRREYFIFSVENKNKEPYRYEMNDKQMTELEVSVIRKIVKRTVHHIKWNG